MHKNAVDKSESSRTNPTDFIVGLIVLLIFFGLPLFGIWSVLPIGIKYPSLYFILYHVPFNQVHVTEQPRDCEWSHSPLGDKGCTYEKEVTLTRDKAGNAISVDVGWRREQAYKAAPTPPKAALIYDRTTTTASAYFSVTHSINACKSMTSDQCQEEARTEESDFYMAFSTAFQLDPSCSGIALSTLGDPLGSQAALNAKLLNAAPINNIWSLQIDFKPETDVQKWSLLSPSGIAVAESRNDAKSMVRTACSILNGKGGSVAG